jgi:hypothetical protein
VEEERAKKARVKEAKNKENLLQSYRFEKSKRIYGVKSKEQ